MTLIAPSRRRALLPVAAAALLALVVPAAARAADPLAAAGGFTVFVAGDASVADGVNDGSLAVGGDLTATGAYAVGGVPSRYVATGDAVPTALYVGGTLDREVAGGGTPGDVTVSGLSHIVGVDGAPANALDFGAAIDALGGHITVAYTTVAVAAVRT